MTRVRLVERDGVSSVEVEQEWHILDGEAALASASKMIVDLGTRYADWHVFFILSEDLPWFHRLVDVPVYDVAAQRCIDMLIGVSHEREAG